MTIFTQLWQKLDGAARIGLAIGATLIALAIAALAFWLLQPDYQVLFGDLSPGDAAAMTAELDKMKVPYRLDNGGNTILVPSEQVYKTRLKLVGRDIPLHGTVGFELFNNADIGMTEFAQKVNYQRALQGELTRTILSYEEIQSARVHLALPEQGLFKKEGSQGKASVSLTLKPGKTLQPHEVQGIQRLVAASVPEIREEDVTVIDQHGVALTRGASGNAESGTADAGNLDGKEAMERYLTRKVSEVLDRTYGAGQSIASVDVIFGHNAVKTTTENVLGANGTGTAGVIVHEHETTRDSVPAQNAVTNPEAPATAHPAPGGGVRDVEYQVGRRVEQVVSGPGAVERINVAVVLRQSLEVDQIDRIRDIVGVAAGIDKARGDSVAVYTMAQFGATPNVLTSGIVNRPDAASGSASAASNTVIPATVTASDASVPARAPVRTMAYLAIGVLAIVLVLAMLRLTRRPVRTEELSPQEREALLLRVKEWVNAKHDGAGGAA
jgi:flagellar M-ring protein FliF